MPTSRRRRIAPGSQFRPSALLLAGFSRWMDGELDQADDLLADAAEEGLEVGAPEAAAVALGERAMIAIGRGDWIEAEELADRAMGLIGRSRIDEYPVSASVFAWRPGSPSTVATSLARQGLLARAQRLRPRLTRALPHLAIQTRLELARAYRRLADAGGAWTMLREIERAAAPATRSGESSLPQVDELRSSLKTLRSEAPGASTLTAAELRLLPASPPTSPSARSASVYTCRATP